MAQKKINIDLSFLDNQFEPIELPSKGKPYPKGNPLSSGTAHIRSWITSEEKLIEKLSGGNFFSIVCKLVSCALQENVDINELTEGDLYFLLYNIRALTYGSKYKIETTCPNCKEKVKVDIDIYNYPLTYINKFDDEISIKLPRTGIQMKMKYPRVRDLIEATENKHSDLFKMGMKLNEEVYRFALCTTEMILPNEEKTVLNDETMEGTFLTYTLNKIWNRLPSADIVEIRSAVRKYQHGYLDNSLVKCPECESYFEAAPLLNYYFFRSGGDESEVTEKLSDDLQ